jgi:hypothetical protein
VTDAPDGTAPGGVRGFATVWYRLAGKPSPATVSILFGAVPALLVLVAAVPGSAGWRLPLAAESVRTDPLLAFSANYVHDDPAHLVGNVLIHWVAVGILYPLTALAGWRRRGLLAVAALVVVPWIVATATLWRIGGTPSLTVAGFSGVNAALFGMAVPAWFAAWDATVDGRNRGHRPGSVRMVWSIGVPAGVVTVLFANPGGVLPVSRVPSVAVVAGAVAVVAAIGLVTTTDRRAWSAFTSGDRGRLLVATGTVGGLAIASTAFGAFVRWATIWHLAGFLSGFLLTYVPALAVGIVRRRPE